MTHIDKSRGLMREIVSAPRVIAWVCLAALVLAAWVYLWRLSGGISGSGGALARDLWASLCAAGPQPFSARAFAAALAMWAAMSLAMMLPTATPMISVFMDISEAARDKGIGVASVGVLVAGYAAAWLGFSLAAAGLQAGLSALAAGGGPDLLSSPWLAGAVFVFAGWYQFAPLKHACLTKCRNPMTHFMADWREDTAGVLRLGVEQGLWCLGCCWALMSVMFVAGFMNLVWMAAFAVLMTLEKIVARPEPLTRASGAGLILAGFGFWAGAVFGLMQGG